jgi:hypothetical protein
MNGSNWHADNCSIVDDVFSTLFTKRLLDLYLEITFICWIATGKAKVLVNVMLGLYPSFIMKKG